VQIGITLVGIVAGAYGATAIAEDFTPAIARLLPAVDQWADEISFGLVIALTTYLSLVLGELIPKRLAVTAPESIASRVARLMAFLAAAGAPLVFILRASTEGLLKLFRFQRAADADVTEEEIHHLIEEGHSVGLIETEEREMIAGVLRLGDRTVRAIMTPRPEIVWLDPDRPLTENLTLIAESNHARCPVARGGLDGLLGVVQTKELLARTAPGGTLDLDGAMRAPLVVPESLPVLRLLETLRAEPVRMAFVADEYGVVLGLVTAADLLEAIAGDVALSPDEAIDKPVQRPDGSWLIDGMTPIDELEAMIGVRNLSDGGAETVAGLVINLLERMPTTGDRVERGLLKFEVVDMDGRRIDKVIVRKEIVEEDDG
jgi:putative hemolysin